MNLRSFRTPRESELGLLRIDNAAGLEIAALPNGCLFAIEHDDGRGRTMLNQIAGLAAGRLHGAHSPANGGLDGGSRWPWRGCAVRRRERPVRLGGRHSRTAPPRHPLAAPNAEPLGMAPGTAQRQRGLAFLRCDPRPGSGARRAQFRDRQRSLRLAIYRPPYRRASALRTGHHEPAEPASVWPPPLGRAWLLRGREKLRDRRAAALRASLSRCRLNRSALRGQRAGRAAAA